MNNETKTRRLLIGGLAVAGLLVIGIAARPFDGAPSEEEQAPPRRVLEVATIQVQNVDGYQIESRFLGQVEAARHSALGFELAGTLRRVHVDDGDQVAAGQVLAELDTARLDASRRQHQARLEEAEANARLAQATYARVARLVVSGAASSQNLDESTQGREAAKASVASASAALQSIEVDISKSVLVAPYAGRVSSRLVDEGAIVAPGQLVLEVIESGAVEVRVGVPPEIAGDVEVGATASLSGPGGARDISARVRRVLPHQDLRTRTVDVILSVPADRGLFPGDLLEWSVADTVSAEGAWLPRTALTSSARGLWAAYVAGSAGDEDAESLRKLERRELEVLHLEGERAFVRGALRDGDAVVVDGLQRLVPGQLVTVAEGALPIASR